MTELQKLALQEVELLIEPQQLNPSSASWKVEEIIKKNNPNIDADHAKEMGKIVEEYINPIYHKLNKAERFLKAVMK